MMRGCSIVIVIAVTAFGCRGKPEPPIRVEGNLITLENQTGRDWSNVEIWLNDHYRVTKPTLLRGERVQVPLDVFVAGFGQRFDTRRQTPLGIQVVATAGGGTPVKLEWGRGGRR
jgi:hypothetical protein